MHHLKMSMNGMNIKKTNLFDMQLMSYDVNHLFFEDKVTFIEVLFRKSKKIMIKMP